MVYYMFLIMNMKWKSNYWIKLYTSIWTVIVNMHEKSHAKVTIMHKIREKILHKKQTK